MVIAFPVVSVAAAMVINASPVSWSTSGTTWPSVVFGPRSCLKYSLLHQCGPWPSQFSAEYPAYSRFSHKSPIVRKGILTTMYSLNSLMEPLKIKKGERLKATVCTNGHCMRIRMCHWFLSPTVRLVLLCKDVFRYSAYIEEILTKIILFEQIVAVTESIISYNINTHGSESVMEIKHQERRSHHRKLHLCRIWNLYYRSSRNWRRHLVTPHLMQCGTTGPKKTQDPAELGQLHR